MSKPFFYPATVLDNKDPLMLGRVRARILTEDYDSTIASVSNPSWNEEVDKWTERDPFIFAPLLPYFIHQVPKEQELIYGFYYNKDYKYQNQFYIQSMFSSPTLSPFEYYVGAQKFTGVGMQYKNPLPLKNQDGSYGVKGQEGVFPEPGDNAFLGRNSADLIVKENEVLLRAGKVQGQIQPNVFPTVNTQRAFLQLSRFDVNKVFDKYLTFNNQIENVLQVKYLIEWVITNPENLQNKFTGSVYLYKLRPNVKTNTKELKVGSDVEGYKFLTAKSDFLGLSKDDTIKFINDFIKTCNSQGDIEGQRVFNEPPHPIFYRPSNQVYEKLLSLPNVTTPAVVSQNISDIYKGVKFGMTTYSGYGLIYKKDTVGLPYDVESKTVDLYKYVGIPTTHAFLGANNISLLSHASSIPGKGKINFDGTLYGITTDTYTDEIEPKTSSMVRGEELLELLELIVRFLATHTHSYPGLPPLPVTQDGTSINRIISELQTSSDKILNQFIRIN